MLHQDVIRRIPTYLQADNEAILHYFDDPVNNGMQTAIDNDVSLSIKDDQDDQSTEA